MSVSYTSHMPRIYRKGVTLMKTMVYLDEKVHERLRDIAFHQRVSMAELIRRAVDGFLPKRGVSKKKGGKK